MHKVLTGLGAVLLALSHPAMAGVPGWTVSESSGQVNVLKSGVSKIALRGAGLSPGDVVVTGVNGRAVLTRGEEFVVVSSGSRIQITDPAKSGGFTQIIENFGNVIYKIKKMATPHFSVQTPYLAAVVKGTTFSVTVTDKGASVQVVEGKVQVDSLDGGASHLTLPGEIALVRADQPFRLDVQGGDAPRTILSPNAPAPGEAAKETASSDTIVAEIDPADAAPASDIVSSIVADNAILTPVAGMMSTSFETGITAQISEGPVRLETVSQGLVSGDTSIPAGAAIPEQGEPAVVVASVESAPPPPAPTPAPESQPAAPVVEVVSAPPAPVAVPAPPPAVEVVSAPPAPAAEPAPAAPVIEVVAAPPAPTDVVAPVPAVTQVAATPPAPTVQVASLPAPASTVATSGGNSGSDDSGSSGSNSGSNNSSNSGSNSGSSGNSGSGSNSGSSGNSGSGSNSGSSNNSGSGSNSGSSKNSGSGSNSGSSKSAPSGSLVITLGSKTLTLNASGASVANNTSGSPALSIASTLTKGSTTTVTTTTISKLTGVTTTTASMPAAVTTPPAGN